MAHLAGVMPAWTIPGRAQVEGAGGPVVLAHRTPKRRRSEKCPPAERPSKRVAQDPHVSTLESECYTSVLVSTRSPGPGDDTVAVVDGVTIHRTKYAHVVRDEAGQCFRVLGADGALLGSYSLAKPCARGSTKRDKHCHPKELRGITPFARDHPNELHGF